MTYQASQIGTLFRRDERELHEKYGKFVAPFFMIEISDQNNNVLFSSESNATDGNYDLNGLVVSQVEWEENDCQADMMMLTVINIDMQLHDSRMFAEGNMIDLWIGYDGHQPEYMGRGIIVTIEPSFTRDTIPTLQITCYDISYFMMEEGRAEIQTEGTQWFERQSVPAQGQGNQQPRTRTNHISDNAQERERRRNERRQAGSPVDAVPSGSIAEQGADTHAATTTITASRDPQRQQTAQPRQRTQLRQARVPGRRRNRGKVWRNLRDDEIAAAIFESYGVVPYTEATDQRARATTQTIEIQTHQGQSELTNYSDTAEQEGDRRRRAIAAGITAQFPRGNIAEHGTSLRVQFTEIRAVPVEGGDRERVTVEVGGRRVVQKSGVSDYEFIKQLAKNHGYIVFVFFNYETKNWIGYWGSPNNVPQHVQYTFHYNNGDDTTIGSFRPRVSMRGQKTEIDLVYTDPVLRREQRLRVSMENVSRYSPEFRGPDSTATIDEPLGNGPEVVLNIHGQRVSVTADRRFQSMDDARRWLMAFWFRHASEFCEAEGDTVIGIPEVRCRHKHIINGYGRYDGNYFFTKVSHKLAPNSIYSTDFSVFRMPSDLEGVPDQESDLMVVDSNEMGQITPEARDVIRRWQDALSQR